jgi:hypothetical protein
MATDKDKQIIRQSQLKLCLDYFNMCGYCPSLADTISITHMLEKFVSEGYSKDMKESFERIDKYISDQYKG